MRKFWQFMILVLATLYVTGCQPSGLSASLDNPVAPEAVDGSLPAPSVEDPSAEAVSDNQAVVDECLSCHSDKARLIDTADPVEEAAESESSGVG